jgi:hypothetical protein
VHLELNFRKNLNVIDDKQGSGGRCFMENPDVKNLVTLSSMFFSIQKKIEKNL